MAAHSSILAWRIPMDRNLACCSPWDRKESDTTERLSTAWHVGNAEGKKTGSPQKGDRDKCHKKYAQESPTQCSGWSSDFHTD